MIGLKGIHTFASDPRLGENSAKKYLEHVLITQMMSAWYWKKLNGPIHLYTTKRDAEFFDRLGMLEIYDHVDIDVLEEEDGIPWDEFRSVAKMKVVSVQTEHPFATIDCDLIFRTELAQHDLMVDMAVFHREAFLNRSHPPLDFLGRRPDYSFPEFLQKKVDLINTGFLIWNNEQITKEYWNLAYDYMKENRAENRRPDWAREADCEKWKSSFVEQRLLGSLLERDNYQVRCLLPVKYSGDTGSWISPNGEMADIGQARKEAGVDFYYLSGEKLAYYEMEPPICTGQQILTFYNLIKSMNLIQDPLMQDILDEIIVFTIQKTYALGLEDMYALRAANKYLIHEF